jgi:hypothetical protein
MKTVETDITQFFKPVMNMRPWRVRIGVGSFITFEFGDKVREHGRLHGAWHLWVYMAEWSLRRNARELATSDSDRPCMSVAVRRLEEQPLTDVQVSADHRTTTFVFGDFQLIVRPAEYLDDPDERDEYWILFLPSRAIVALGPGGITVESESE